MDFASTLRTHPLFSHCSDRILESLASVVSLQQAEGGTAILRQQASPAALSVVLDGEIRIFRLAPRGAIPLRAVRRETLLGDLCYVENCEFFQSSASAAANTSLLAFDTPLLRVRAAADDALEHALHWSLWRSLGLKLRAADDRLEGLIASLVGGDGVSLGLPARGAGESSPRPPRIDPEEKRRFFQQQLLSPLEVEFLAGLSRERRLAPGQPLFAEGDPAGSMFTVLEGQVEIHRYIPGAGMETLALLDPGAYFGELALADHLPRSANASGSENGALVLELPREAAEEALSSTAAHSLRLLRLLCSLSVRRLRHTDQQILDWHLLRGDG